MFDVLNADGAVTTILDPEDLVRDFRAASGRRVSFDDFNRMAGLTGLDEYQLEGWFKKFLAKNDWIAPVLQIAAPIVGSIIPGVGTVAGLAISAAVGAAARVALQQAAPPPAGVEADPETGVAVGSTVIIAPIGAGLPAGLTLPEAQVQKLGDGRSAWILAPGKNVPGDYKWPDGTQAYRTAKGSNLVILPILLAPPPIAPQKKPAPKPAAASKGAGLVIAAVVVAGLVLLARGKR